MRDLTPTGLSGLVLTAMLVVTLGCSTDANSPDPGPPDQGEPPGEEPTLAEMVANLDTQRPSWDQLQPFAEGLTRAPRPAFWKAAHAGSEALTLGSSMADYLEHWDGVSEDFDIHLSPALMANVPPFPDDTGTVLRPYSQELGDEKLRGFAAILLQEKQRGRQVRVVNFYPVFTDYQFSTESELDAWIDQEYLPEKIAEAQAAEFVKAESFIPFMIEVEIFFSFVADRLPGPLSEAELVVLAQDFVDRVETAVRPHFNGALVAHSYKNFTNDPEGDAVWTTLDFSAYDELHIGFFPGCDVITTEQYFDAQMAAYADVIERAGIPWFLNEVLVEPSRFRDLCAQDFAAIEPDVYQAIFDRIDAMANPPDGVGVSVHALETVAGRNVVRTYLDTK